MKSNVWIHIKNGKVTSMDWPSFRGPLAPGTDPEHCTPQHFTEFAATAEDGCYPILEGGKVGPKHDTPDLTDIVPEMVPERLHERLGVKPHKK